MRRTKRQEEEAISAMLALVRAELAAGSEPEDLHFEAPFFTWILFDATSRAPYTIEGVRVYLTSNEDSGDVFTLWKRL